MASDATLKRFNEIIDQMYKDQYAFYMSQAKQIRYGHLYGKVATGLADWIPAEEKKNPTQLRRTEVNEWGEVSP